MNSNIREYFFRKGYFIEDSASKKNPLEVLIALGKKFNIRVVSGRELASVNMLKLAQQEIGYDVPASFYKFFPQSVKALFPVEQMLNQAIQYVNTYGLNDFKNPGHATFEETFEELAYDEEGEKKEFKILTLKEAKTMAIQYADDLLKGTRPLSTEQFNLILGVMSSYRYLPKIIASRNTAVELVVYRGDLRYTKFFGIADIINYVEQVNYEYHDSANVKKLNLHNFFRRMIKAMLDEKLENVSEHDIRICCEKKKIWCGLLHHIHYKPKTEAAKLFVNTMRGKANGSYISEIEKLLKADFKKAVELATSSKGANYVLRHINYYIWFAKDSDDIKFLIDKATNKANPLLLLQLLKQYCGYKTGIRTFSFVKFHLKKSFTEENRKNYLPQRIVNTLKAAVLERIKEHYRANTLGKIYIDPSMKKMALPLQMAATQSGYGTLAPGSRVAIGSKNIRAFTYWEKINDVDISMFGLCGDDSIIEFSWRTVGRNGSTKLADAGVTFSGDQTSGYNGGSEYFDIEIDKVKEHYPNIKYLILNDYAYTNLPFSQCVCRAGFMLREDLNKGKAFEPASVKTSFKVNCNSTSAILFAIDVDTNELVWINQADSRNNRFGAGQSIECGKEYMNILDSISLYSFFEYLASEVVATPEEADVVVSDDYVSAEKTVIRSNDYEVIIKYLNT